jgi:uncharacterized protein with ParB-like and HNH nuclease domain
MIKIIDGQQRLTTSVLLLCAIRDVLKDIHGIDVNYTNITSDVINPGGSDISNSAFDDIVERKHLKLSNPSYRKENYYINYLIFYEHLKTKSKEEIESFGATYVKNFKIACISFNEDALSNKKEMEIFENLNTKGKNLDLFDITKNFIFNLCEEQTLNKYERDVVVEFNHLISNLPSEKEEKKQS